MENKDSKRKIQILKPEVPEREDWKRDENITKLHWSNKIGHLSRLVTYLIILYIYFFFQQEYELPALVRHNVSKVCTRQSNTADTSPCPCIDCICRKTVFDWLIDRSTSTCLYLNWKQARREALTNCSLLLASSPEAHDLPWYWPGSSGLQQSIIKMDC